MRNQLPDHDCLLNAASRIGYIGCVKLLAAPVLIAGALGIYVLVRCCKLLCGKKEQFKIGWPVLVFLTAAITGVYLNGCFGLSKYDL